MREGYHNTGGKSVFSMIHKDMNRSGTQTHHIFPMTDLRDNNNVGEGETLNSKTTLQEMKMSEKTVGKNGNLVLNNTLTEMNMSDMTVGESWEGVPMGKNLECRINTALEDYVKEKWLTTRPMNEVQPEWDHETSSQFQRVSIIGQMEMCEKYQSDPQYWGDKVFPLIMRENPHVDTSDWSWGSESWDWEDIELSERVEERLMELVRISNNLNI